MTAPDAPNVQARATIDEGLAGYNKKNSGTDDRRNLAVLVTDPRSGEVVGGILGWTSLGLLSATCRPSALLCTAAKRMPARLNCSATSFSARSTYAASRCCSVSLESGVS